ncbi:hypothetical protein ACIA6T_16925 [Streptomyces sp. NPDC051740]|uniref:hypothetical protein n=1 Tax=Streptomyces sp. NPDC051740 TaxID=3365673 RepID=UPI0037AE01B5
MDVEQFLARAPAFTGLRELALTHAVLTLPDAAPADDEIAGAPEACSLHGLHTWARVQVTAVKAILTHTHGHRTVGEQDRELLRSTRQPGTVWKANPADGSSWWSAPVTAIEIAGALAGAGAEQEGRPLGGQASPWLHHYGRPWPARVDAPGPPDAPSEPASHERQDVCPYAATDRGERVHHLARCP